MTSSVSGGGEGLSERTRSTGPSNGSVGLGRVDAWLAPFARRLRDSSILQILEYTSRLAVVVAVVSFFFHLGDARKEREYQAWQAINSADGKSGDGGREYALGDLLNDDVSLAGVNLAGAQLRWLTLPNADLRNANLRHAVVTSGRLTGAYLGDARLDCPLDATCDPSPVDFWDADLHYANLERVSAFGANFGCADLHMASIRYADLTNAYFGHADLRKADLTGATLTGACLQGADLTGAEISDAQLQSARGSDVVAPGHAQPSQPCAGAHPRACDRVALPSCGWWQVWCRE